MKRGIVKRDFLDYKKGDVLYFSCVITCSNFLYSEFKINDFGVYGYYLFKNEDEFCSYIDLE